MDRTYLQTWLGDKGFTYSNAYNKGKTLVFSKVPLPDYRADLDERHGSTQKEIKMSNQTERRVEDLLSRSKLSTNDSASSSNVSMRQSLPSTSSSVVEQPADIDKEKLSSQLRNLQNSRKVLSMNATPSPPLSFL